MSFKYPNYYNSYDRHLYDKLVNESFERKLTDEEYRFVNTVYHQEEFDAGLDGDDYYEENEEEC